MDGLDQRHDRILEKFLAGVLDLADASKWDEHLLECEPCWRAVREDMEARRATTGARLRIRRGWFAWWSAPSSRTRW